MQTHEIMDEINDIYTAIATDGFSERTLQMIKNLTNDIQYGRKDFIGFTLSEHAGLCKGGTSLIGASIVVGYARRSLTAGGNAESGEGSIVKNFGPMIAQGAEAKVYYKAGDFSVAKERTSIYSTTQSPRNNMSNIL